MPHTLMQQCYQAAALVEKAGRSQADKATLMQAFSLYAQVAENPQCRMAEPYLGMAAIMAACQEYEQANGLLNQAKKLEPANMRVTQMKTRIERLMKKNQLTASLPVAPLEHITAIRENQANNRVTSEAELDALLQILTATDEQLVQWMSAKG